MATALETLFLGAITIAVAAAASVDEALALGGKGVVVEHVDVVGTLTAVDGHLADLVHRH